MASTTCRSEQPPLTAGIATAATRDRPPLCAAGGRPATYGDLDRLAYTTQAIKETLRLHPPAATARYVPPGTGFTVRTPAGEDRCLDGLIIYNCEGLIQRDPSVYGETANDFVPERWLGDASGHVPAAAWRPFERGPRGCIGQEFAMIEIRIIIAAVAHRFDLNKVGLGELALDVVKAANLLGEGTLEGGGVRVQLRAVSMHCDLLYSAGNVVHLRTA